MVAQPKLGPSRMTVAEFLDWEGDETDRKFELVDGEPRAMAPASGTHGLIEANHHGYPRQSPARHDRCHVAAEPGIVPRVRSSANMRVPDLAVNCVPDESGQRALPDPILIIEILSPSNEAETRENVWAYTTIPSVREILLVRSTDIGAELFRRQDDGNWPEQPELIGNGDEFALDSIGFRAKLGDFYEDTHLRRDGAR